MKIFWPRSDPALNPPPTDIQPFQLNFSSNPTPPPVSIWIPAT